LFAAQPATAADLPVKAPMVAPRELERLDRQRAIAREVRTDNGWRDRPQDHRW